MVENFSCRISTVHYWIRLSFGYDVFLNVLSEGMFYISLYLRDIVRGLFLEKQPFVQSYLPTIFSSFNRWIDLKFKYVVLLDVL
jgi:hypothetical protein